MCFFEKKKDPIKGILFLAINHIYWIPGISRNKEEYKMQN